MNLKTLSGHEEDIFGCSLDGDSTFEVVNRVIQTCELYMAGVEGDFWQANYYSYQDSLTKTKMKWQLSSEIRKHLGSNKVI